MTGTATATLCRADPGSASRRTSLVATAAHGGLGWARSSPGSSPSTVPPTVLVFQVYLAVLAVAGLCLFWFRRR
jgi:hypothetical protein